MKNPKTKGSQGERELASVLTEAGYPAHRNDQRNVGGFNNPDISAEGLEGWHFEVKRVAHLNLGEAMQQAERDAAGRVPLVAHRRNRQPWLVTMHLTDWLRLLRGGGGRP